MKDFSNKDLEELERFSRIKCTPEEEPALLEGLKKIIKYIDLLNEIDTEDVLSCNFVQQNLQQNVMREDSFEETIDPNIIFENAPEQTSNLIKVPKIL